MKERALKIANDLYTQHIPVDEIAFTIRSLIEELDRIKTINKDLGGYIDFIEKQRILAEPVAWMLIDETNGDYMLEKHPSGDYEWQPLYKSPQYRKLSDGEIAELFDKYCENDGGSYFDFARAIEERHGIK